MRAGGDGNVIAQRIVVQHLKIVQIAGAAEADRGELLVFHCRCRHKPGAGGRRRRHGDGIGPDRLPPFVKGVPQRVGNQHAIHANLKRLLGCTAANCGCVGHRHAVPERRVDDYQGWLHHRVGDHAAAVHCSVVDHQVGAGVNEIAAFAGSIGNGWIGVAGDKLQHRIDIDVGGEGKTLAGKRIRQRITLRIELHNPRVRVGQRQPARIGKGIGQVGNRGEVIDRRIPAIGRIDQAIVGPVLA